MIVDDDPDMRWALDRLLRKEAFTRVVHAGSGFQALALLQKGEYDLIILDAKLPDIEGMRLTRRIRDETRSAAPVLLLSGYLYGDEELVQESVRSGLISAFLAKPFLHEELLRVIRNVLAGNTPAKVAQ